MAKVHLEVSMPDSELQAFVQTIRLWDAGRPEIRARMTVAAVDLTIKQIDAVLAVEPVVIPLVVKFTDPSGC